MPTDSSCWCAASTEQIKRHRHRHRTVRHLPELCAPNADHDLDVAIARIPTSRPPSAQWYVDAGFEELTFDTDEGFLFGVGTFRLTAPPLPYVPGRHLFDFIGH